MCFWSVQHAAELVGALADDGTVLGSGSPLLRSGAVACLVEIVAALRRCGAQALDAHFMATGRLAAKRKLMAQATRALVVWRASGEASEAAQAQACLASLAALELRDEAPAARRLLEVRPPSKTGHRPPNELLTFHFPSGASSCGSCTTGV